MEARHVWEGPRVDGEGGHRAGMPYRAWIREEDPPAQAGPAIDALAKAGRIIRWNGSMTAEELVARIDELVPVDVQATPASPDLRVRHVCKGGRDYYLLFNEGAKDLECRLMLSAKGSRILMDPVSGRSEPAATDSTTRLAGHAMQVLAVA